MMPFVVTKDKTAAPKKRHPNLLRHPKPVLKLCNVYKCYDRLLQMLIPSSYFLQKLNSKFYP